MAIIDAVKCMPPTINIPLSLTPIKKPLNIIEPHKKNIKTRMYKNISI